MSTDKSNIAKRSPWAIEGWRGALNQGSTSVWWPSIESIFQCKMMQVVFGALCLVSFFQVLSTAILLPWNDDVLGLIVFKADLHDPHSALASWSEDDSSPCNWTGIKCSPVNGRVVGVFLDGLSLSGPLGRGLFKLEQLETLSLSKNNLSGGISPDIQVLQSLKNLSLNHNSLSGEVPATLGNVGSLSYLDLSYNAFSGMISPQVFTSCQNLRYVSLSGNQLEGQFPDSISNCKGLAEVAASQNRFSGGLPAGIGALSRLTSLDLSHNSLSGEMSSQLSLCTMLRTLDLSYNMLSGKLPSFLQSLLQLSVLNLRANSFSGNIPDWIGNLTQLVELNLAENGFVGPIPSSIGSLESLQHLYLHSNILQGALPLSLLACSKLSSIDFSSNNLTGVIPNELFELDLENVALSRNDFTGGFPVFSPLVCKSLQALDLSENYLEGEIPPHIANCPRIDRLNLAYNSFVGHIPEELGSMAELSALDLSNNVLTGFIPTSFVNAASLQTLRLDGNLLVGAIPEELGNCTSLKYLDLSYNNLTGSIPVELGELSDLQGLDLSWNHLTGQIPASLGQLQNLSVFNVSHNSLAGPVPTEGVFPLLDSSSFRGNSHLCGAPLNVDCPVIPKPIVLNPNATRNPTPIITSPGPRSKIVLSISAILAISAAALIALGIVIVSLLNLRTRTARPRASFVVVDSLPGSSPSEDLAIGKLVMFTDDSDSSKNEDLLPTAQALLNKNSEIGRGGFGTVYKATLAAGRTVAVKKLTLPGLVRSQHEFEKRVQFLGKIQHESLVNFQGYYWTPKLQLLIYDYIPNGNLYWRLHEQVGEAGPLPWELRFRIALGAALGLAYLHHKCRPRVIHYNVKSSNVLLDEHCNARIADYGLAKLLPGRDRHVMVSKYQNALGYMAPECVCESVKVTDKCDVYGFGVILLELISGKRPVEYMEDDVVILCDYIRSLVDEGKPFSCVDPRMSSYPEDELLTVIKLGLVCTSQIPSNRPTMPEVVQILELIKPLGDNKDSA